jgi:hypothetical protein
MAMQMNDPSISLIVFVVVSVVVNVSPERLRESANAYRKI